MSNKTFFRLLLLFFLCCAIYVCLQNVSAVKQTLSVFFKAIRPVTIGCVIAFVLNIPMRKLEKVLRRRMNKRPNLASALSVFIVYVVFAGLAVLFFTFLIPQLSNSFTTLYTRLPEYWETISQWYEKVVEKLEIKAYLDSVLENILADFSDKVSDYTAAAGAAAVRLGMQLGSGAFSFVLGFIFSIYLLIEKHNLRTLYRAVCDRLIKNEKRRCAVGELLQTVYVKFSSYIGGQVLDAALLGGLCALGMWIIGLPYAALVGIIMAVTALVPIIGAWAGGGVSALLILMESPVQALVFIVFVIALQQLENNLLYPRIVGDALELGGLWVLASVTLGGALFGLWGMILGAPALSVAAVYVRRHILPRKNAE